MNQTTMEQLKQMRLYGMSRALAATQEPGAASYTGDELLAFLVRSEWDDRQNRRVERLTKSARFRYGAVVEAIDYDPARGLDKDRIRRFATCAFVERGENILVTGSTGVGKSYIASALGHQACSMNHKTLYFSTAKLFTQLKTSKADGSYQRLLARIERQDLLILDDFGLRPLDNIDRNALMEVIEDRHGKRSTIIASQLPVEAWHDVIGDKTLADAILDRLVHSAHRLDIKGESMRKKLKQKN